MCQNNMQQTSGCTGSRTPIYQTEVMVAVQRQECTLFFWREILDFFAVAVDDQRTGCPGGALLELCHNGASIIID